MFAKRILVAVLLAVVFCGVFAKFPRIHFSELSDVVDEVIQTLSDSSNAKRCTTTFLDVRSQPRVSSKLLRTLPPNSSVNVVSNINSQWAKIGYGQYVSRNYLKMCAAPSTRSVSNVRPSVSSGGISLQQLRSIMPNLSSSRANLYLPALNTALAQGGLNNCPRKAAFLAQLAHESGQLIYWEELASGKAYEGRRDLGNTQPGDGVRYKGRGPIQLTGRANYRAAGKALGLPLEQNPKMVSEVNVGFRTSIWFWNSRGLSNIADANTQSAFDRITRAINGGYNGKADRDMFWRRAKSVLGC